MATRTFRIVCSLVAVVALVFVLPFVFVLAIQHFRKPSEHRFSFPASKQLTGQDALELTRQAMILDGKSSDAMRPVLSGHKDADGYEAFFCRKSGISDEGWVLWWLKRPDHEGEYSVNITREANDAVCTITKPL